MSLAEIRDYMESYARRKKQEFKQRVSEKHFLAEDIAQYVSIVINGSGDRKPLELWDYFPALFAEEAAAAKNSELEVYKAQMNDFVYRHNHETARNGGER